jgi:thioredoxin 1
MTEMNAAQFNELRESGAKIVVDFYAEWCGPCRMMEPVLKEVSTDMSEEDIVFVKINADNERDLCGEFGVRGIPTFAMINNGEIVDRFTGVRGKNEMRQTIEQAFNG